jgi:hypothetical protein
MLPAPGTRQAGASGSDALSPAKPYDLAGRAYGPDRVPRYSIMKRFAFLLFLALLLASCASSNGMVRKCDGHRGTRVPMGVL